MERALVSAKELAAILGVPYAQVCRMAHRGEIPVIKVGKYYRFMPEEVIAALRKPARKDPGDELR